MDIEVVKLKNGAELQKSLVITISISIKQLFETRPIAAYELVMKCRNPNHRLFGQTGKDLQDAALLDSANRVHDAIRNVVLSGVIGEGFGMTWTSPVAT
jgi:hypothetical protein